MDYRPLGRTGVLVSPLCLGDSMVYYGTEPGQVEATLARALDAGINFIDSGDHKGPSEEVIGRQLKALGCRDRVVLATKAGPLVPEGHEPNVGGASRRQILRQCEASLRRLQTDHIDLYYIHRLGSSTPIDEHLGALDDLVRAGKVRFLGTSSAGAWQLMESLWVAKELGLNRFVCEQPPYNLLDRRIESELVPIAQTYGFAVCPWAPLAGGLLTGKYRRGASLPPGSRFAAAAGDPPAAATGGNANAVQRSLTFLGIDPESRPLGRAAAHLYPNRLSEGTFRVVDELEAIAREHERTAAQVAMAWCLGQPWITSPVIGPRSVEQLEVYLAALELRLTSEDRDRLDLVAPPEDMVMPYWIGDFGPPTFRW